MMTTSPHRPFASFRPSQPWRVRLQILGLLVFGICLAASASAKDIYLAQSAAGAATGADCADAQAASFFNSSGNWGSGAAQIGPGTTVHLCGTIAASLTAKGMAQPTPR
jgi:hypothetical protein